VTTRKTSLIQLPDARALASRASERVLAAADSARAECGAFHIALAGGSTPRALYELLAQSGADFAQWHIYFGDERAVPPDHADSNFRMASEAWLARGGVPAAQVHRIRGELDAPAAAASYEEELAQSFGTREVPRFDLVLLGMGADGHTASLFPGTTALSEARRTVAATWVEKLAANRITLTLRTLNAARHVLFLVAGADKAPALREVLFAREGAPQLPAARVRPWDGEVTWMVDRAAAAGLRDA
jgi:6-phosphogluconolactonase